MLSQLNEISSVAIGIISIAVIVVILLSFVIIGIKRGAKNMLPTFLIFALSLALAILLSKPLLSLFDSMFGFSMVFFNLLMFKFGAYQSLNIQVTSVNYSAVVENFNNTDIGMSSNLKSFLSKVFEVSSVKTDATTTLGAVASTTVSYMISLFIVAFVIFIVLSFVITVLYKLIFKKFNKQFKSTLKPVGALIGLVQGVIISVMLIVTLSTFPVFGLNNDYLGDGFESTKVLSTPYRLIVDGEQAFYFDTIGFATINQNASQTKQNLAYGNYTNNDVIDADYTITVTLTQNEIIETFVSNHTTTVGSNTYTYILVNNNLYLYKDNVLQANWAYKFGENSVIKYKAEIDGNVVTYDLK